MSFATLSTGQMAELANGSCATDGRSEGSPESPRNRTGTSSTTVRRAPPDQGPSGGVAAPPAALPPRGDPNRL